MTDKKSSESRRKLLKSIAAGSGAIVAGKNLPESWSRPVVDSVMLPAHAQTSLAPLYSTIATRTENQSDGNTMIAGIMERLVPTAEAGGISDVCITGCGKNDGTNLNIDCFDVCEEGVAFAGSLPLDGTFVEIEINFCVDEPGSEELQVSDIDGSMARIADRRGNSFTMMATDRCPSIPTCPPPPE